MIIYRATVDSIDAIERQFEVAEHIDVKNLEAYAKTPERAKAMLVDTLSKRKAGALQVWECARDKLAKAEALEIM